MRRLIVNADDFGLTSGVNRGIIEAHTRGIVTSATLMARGAQFQEAATLAARAPKLAVGCHVLLVDGPPALNHEQVPTLMGNSASRFRESLSNFAVQAILSKLDGDQIEAEVTAQIRILQANGIPVSHLDSHKHTHMFPVVFKAMIRAAKSCGVRAIRNPFEPLLFVNAQNWKRQFQLGILRGYRSSFRRELAKAGIMTPDGCVGIVVTGGLSSDSLQKLLESLPEGTWELVTHPGCNDRDLDRIRTRLRDSRDKELKILTSQIARDTLQREGIELISYRDLSQT